MKSLSVALALLSGCALDAVIARPRADASVRDGGARWLITGEIISTIDRSAVDGGDMPQTRFSLELRPRPEESVSVTLESTLGAVTLRQNGDRFEGQQRGYAPQYALVLGSEAASFRAVFRGPEVHAISAPTSNEHRVSESAMEVRWSPSGASEASIETEQLAETPTEDDGLFVIPADRLVIDGGTSRADSVRVRRAESSVPEGAAEGSYVRIVVQVRVPFHLDAR